MQQTQELEPGQKSDFDLTRNTADSEGPKLRRTSAGVISNSAAWLSASNTTYSGGSAANHVLCGLRGCRNRPCLFPGRMSYKATKPGSVCPVFLPRFLQCCCQDLFYVSRPRPRPGQNELECTRVSRPWSRDHNTGFLSVSVVLLTRAQFCVVLFCDICVFCLLVVVVRLSVQVIDWKNSSLKWPVMCWWGLHKALSLTAANHDSRPTWVCVSPSDAASSALSGRPRYCVRWNLLVKCCSCRLV